MIQPSESAILSELDPPETLKDWSMKVLHQVVVQWSGRHGPDQRHTQGEAVMKKPQSRAVLSI